MYFGNCIWVSLSMYLCNLYLKYLNSKFTFFAGVLSWKNLLDLGKTWPYLKNKLEDRLKQVAINQCCRLVYTSGTTGAPKAVMLSHDNLIFTAKVMNQVYGLNPNGQERNVSYLPLSHVAASMMDNFVILSCRGTTYFADKSALKVKTLEYFSMC